MPPALKKCAMVITARLAHQFAHRLRSGLAIGSVLAGDLHAASVRSHAIRSSRSPSMTAAYTRPRFCTLVFHLRDHAVFTAGEELSGPFLGLSPGSTRYGFYMVLRIPEYNPLSHPKLLYSFSLTPCKEDIKYGHQERSIWRVIGGAFGG